MKYGVIGPGMMGVEHIMNINHIDGASVVAVADPDISSRKVGVEAAGGNIVSFADHRELLDSGLCDAVVIASPNMTHADILVDTISARVPTLVEKPLCTTVEDCRRAIDAQAEHGTFVQVGLEYRWMAPIAVLLDEVRGGAAGAVQMVAIREHRYPFLPKVGNWNRFNRNTGGTLVEKCCHFFGLMALVIGAPPVRVYASGSQDVNHLNETYDGHVPDILDNAYVVIDWEDGTRSMLDLCMFADGSVNEQEIVVVGDAGKVEAFVPEGLVRVAGRDKQVRTQVVHNDHVPYLGVHHGSSYLEHIAFLDAIRNGTEPPVTLEDGMLTVAIGVAGHRSIDEDRPVALEEVLG